MNESLTDELRATLHERFEDVAATPSLYDHLQRRIERRRRSRVTATLASAVAVLAAIVLVPNLFGSGEMQIVDRPGEMAGSPDAVPATDPTHALFTTNDGGLVGVDLASGQRLELVAPGDHAAAVADLSVAAGSTLEDFTAIAFDDGAGPIGFITYLRRDGGEVRTSFTPNDDRVRGHSNRGTRTISPDGRWLAYSGARDSDRGVGLVPIDAVTGELDTDGQRFVEGLSAPAAWTGPVSEIGDRSMMVHNPDREGQFTATSLERTQGGFEVIETVALDVDSIQEPDASSTPRLVFGSVQPGQLDDARFSATIEPSEVEIGERVRPDHAVVHYNGPDGESEVRFELLGSGGNIDLAATAQTALLTVDGPDLGEDEGTDGEAWLIRTRIDGNEVTLEPHGPLIRNVVSGALLQAGDRRNGDLDGTGTDVALPDRASDDADNEAADGSENAAVPTDPTPEGSDTHLVEVYFTVWDESGHDELVAAQRTVSAPEVLTGTLGSLLQGPTEQEQADGYTSWFSTETSELLLSVRVEDGTAYVDFDPSMREIIANASTSSGAGSLLAELDTTVTQFDTVDDAIYSLDGAIEDFYSWLQMTPPDH